MNIANRRQHRPLNVICKLHFDIYDYTDYDDLNDNQGYDIPNVAILNVTDIYNCQTHPTSEL